MDTDNTSVLDKLKAGAYQLDWSKLPEPKDNAAKAQWRKAMREAEGALVQQFVVDLEAEYGMTGHPAAAKTYGLAYERGHSGGLHEVYLNYDELARLVLDGMDDSAKKMAKRLAKINELINATGGRTRLPLVEQIRAIAAGEQD